MIVIHMCDNGLGNQLFVYALGTLLAERYGKKEVFYDLSRLPDAIVGRKLRPITEGFDLDIQIASASMVRKYSGMKFYYRIPFVTNRLKKSDKYWYKYQNFINRHVKQPSGVIFIKETEEWWRVSRQESEENDRRFRQMDMTKNYYVDGYWENPVYYEKEQSLLREKLCFRDLDVLHSTLAQKICEENSVSMHIRRGDYLRTYDAFQYNLCDEKYYRAAMDHIEERVAHAHFYVFTDDADYAEQVYGGREDVTVVKGYLDYEDLALMSLCKHNILANSTFSFWGAFLNKNPDKIVVTTDVHYLRKVDDEWQKIPFPAMKEWHVLR